MAILIMLNNYLHDLATGVFLVSVIFLYNLGKNIALREEKSGEVLLEIYQKVNKTAIVSLIWILIGGVPRLIFFKKYEWWDAVGKGIVSALVFKHILLFSAVFIGLLIMYKTRRSIYRT